MEFYLAEAQLLLSTQDGELRVGPANDLERYNRVQCTWNIVQIGKEHWVHLESGTGLVQDLAIVVTKDGKEEAYIKFLRNMGLHL